ncbi:unnamed protein product [Allacma fusca]|uniref:Uncharacterized protein n=1 Tax=Allacma fusca TaxID=39272 RepID=A0A8J2LWV3_9HEXA|nr:unnamed protein product [Allacma fusca]
MFRSLAYDDVAETIFCATHSTINMEKFLHHLTTRVEEVSLELNSVRKCLTSATSAYNLLKEESTEPTPDQTSPPVAVNERDSNQILEEILLELKAIKSKLIENGNVETNNSADHVSNSTQLEMSQEQVPEEVFEKDNPKQSSSPKSTVGSDQESRSTQGKHSEQQVTDPIVNDTSNQEESSTKPVDPADQVSKSKEKLWLEKLKTLKTRLPTPVMGFTMTKKALKNLLANGRILKGSIKISNYTNSAMSFDGGFHSGGLHPECIPGLTTEIIRYRPVTVNSDRLCLVDGFSYEIGSTGLSLNVGVAFPPEGAGGLRCSIALTKKSVALSMSLEYPTCNLEHITSDGSFSRMEHKTFKIKENDPSQLGDSKTLGHIVLKCGNMTAMAAISLKEDGTGIQIQIDLMPYIPESNSIKSVLTPCKAY